ITITSGNSGTGSGTVNYSVTANTGPTRTGTLTIAGQTFTVIQDSGCSFSLNPTGQSFPASGGTNNVSVMAGAGCAWSAVSNNPEMITITLAASGTGEGTITYQVAAHNNLARRVGTISVAGQTFTVLQGAYFLDVPPEHSFYTFIGKLSAHGITSGCGSGYY